MKTQKSIKWMGIALVVLGLWPWFADPSGFMTAMATYQDETLAREFPLVRIIVLGFILVPALHIVTGVTLLLRKTWGKYLTILILITDCVYMVRSSWQVCVDFSWVLVPDLLIRLTTIAVCTGVIICLRHSEGEVSAS